MRRSFAVALVNTLFVLAGACERSDAKDDDSAANGVSSVEERATVCEAEPSIAAKEPDKEKSATEEADTELRAELSSAAAELGAIEEQLERYKAEHADLNDELRASEAGRAAAEQRAALLEKDVEAAASALAEAERELDTFDYTETREELSQAEVLIAELHGTLTELPTTVSLALRFLWDGQPLELGQPLRLQAGQVTFEQVRYWLSNVSLIRVDGSTLTVPDSYYLMDLRGEQRMGAGVANVGTMPAARREQVLLAEIPPGSYSGIAFHVGVDPEHNADLSLPGGELNVLRNMAMSDWMWFTSYVFTRVGATYSPDAPADFAEATATPPPGTDAAGPEAEVEATATVEGGLSPDALPLLWDTGTDADLRRVELRFAQALDIRVEAASALELGLELQRLFEGMDLLAIAAAGASPGRIEVDASMPEARATLANNWQAAFVVMAPPADP